MCKAMTLALGAMLTMTFQYNQSAQELLALSSTTIYLCFFLLLRNLNQMIHLIGRASLYER
jgi:hypothetical protein